MYEMKNESSHVGHRGRLGSITAFQLICSIFYPVTGAHIHRHGIAERGRATSAHPAAETIYGIGGCTHMAEISCGGSTRSLQRHRSSRFKARGKIIYLNTMIMNIVRIYNIF